MSVCARPKLRSERRLAVPVDDHRLDYTGFEGVIPTRTYGAGAELEWDRSVCERGGDAVAVLAADSFRF
ncbi:DNA polymerase ligase N-terminal domain-containing protein [Methylobacterium pseudosasicola]|uniref:DNA polymerase ligase N-terminal domain-containing protein n=1 Tax=Methylobacterium pseudosasicola TaxID=582667 RepID=UPI000B87BDF9